jgi:hypothetical protein
MLEFFLNIFECKMLIKILRKKNHYYVTNCTKYVFVNLFYGLNRLHRFFAKNRPVFKLPGFFKP